MMRPSAQVSVSPGSTRRIPGKIVSAPVVNWICSSSSRAAVRTARGTMPAASSACASDAKARPAGVCAVYSGLMPNGSRASVTVRPARSWIAIPYMPRSRVVKSAPSRTHSCSGTSLSLLVAKCTSGISARNSR